ncbi:MAG: DUF4878 domain-containing protein, partial [Actinobacteria bacterium]|nr:DUF4878 domain-containing protein [Actinomycetota bacterium]
ATPDDPKDAVETYLNALAESDWDTAYYMVDKNTKDNHSQEEFEEATNTVYGPEFKEMLTRIEVVDSQTSGDSATVTIRDKVTGNNMEEKLVREDGEWKVTSPDPE